MKSTYWRLPTCSRSRAFTLVVLTTLATLGYFQFSPSGEAPLFGAPRSRPGTSKSDSKSKKEKGAKPKPTQTPVRSPYTVLGYNELGMHCMNEDFSEICILPPFNTLRAQVIDRSGEEPRIVTQGVTLSYSIPGNTKSSNKTNFWDYAQKLFGMPHPLLSDVGLTGNTLSGLMTVTPDNDWSVTGIPITPLTDKMQNDPFQLSQIVVRQNSTGNTMATTKAVVPVSWEINCNLCHNTPGISVATDILRKHDKLHGTQLEQVKPVLCASCHADAALGTTGVKGVKAFSHAMHGSHASRMAALPNVKNACYACHPGVQTECQRDVHLTKGITCVNCHGEMTAVADTKRRPWVDEPTCAQCHQKRKSNFEFEQRGKLFKDSKGHGGVHCAACHGPQHATTPTVTTADNAQAILQQGKAGVISDCTVCHSKKPDEAFFHKLDD